MRNRILIAWAFSLLAIAAEYATGRSGLTTQINDDGVDIAGLPGAAQREVFALAKVLERQSSGEHA